MAPFRARFTPQSRDVVMKRLRELAPRAEEAAARAQESAAKELAEAIRQRAPVRTGNYRDSIIAAKIAGRNGVEKPVGIRATKDPNAWGIFADWRWRFLEFGTRPHTIKPKAKPYLVFEVDGKRVRASKVEHPGIPRNSRAHIFPTYRAMRKRLLQRIRNAVNKEIRKAKG